MTGDLDMNLGRHIRPVRGTRHTPDGRHIETTRDERPTAHAGGAPAPQTNEKIRVMLAVYNAVCPHCGASNVTDPGSIKVSSKQGNLRYTLCTRCGKPGPQLYIEPDEDASGN